MKNIACETPFPQATERGLNPGLQGVLAATTRLSSVDGEAGQLIIAGYAVEELAPRASCEETLYLLWHGGLPNGIQLEEFRAELAARRELSAISRSTLSRAARSGVSPMDLLRMTAGTIIAEGDLEAAMTVVAQLPTLLAAGWRLLQDKEPIGPRAELGHAANFLWMLDGEEPIPGRTRALETYLNTVMDHGLNASTFTARVITSTGSDLISAIVGAIGALKGPLHGGAPGPALDMVFEIGVPDRIEPYLRAKLERGERLMGFGHRVYKVRDPRAEVLEQAAERFFQDAGDKALYSLARQVERIAVELLEEYKPGRRLQTNVEFYTALLLHGLGMPVELFTPIFTLGRAGGWCGHCFEQRVANRIMRPESLYVGPKALTWSPLELRSAAKLVH